jgi:hypothetical protein
LADPTSGKSVVVVRVDESPEAPHAVEKGTEVYVYERTGSINKRWSLAHIDRIAYLLNRRRQYDQERESFIRQAITRGQRYLNAPAPAVRWASIIPLYPWRRLCDPEVCYSIHHGLQRHSLQRFPDGSFAMHGVGGPEAIESISARGHLFIMEYPSESRDNPIAKRHDVKANDFLVWNRTVALANKLMFQLAKPFFENPSVELPGLMQFDFGFLNAFGKQMLGEAEQVGRPFPDSEFRAQVLFPVEDLIRGNMANEQQLFQEIMFGFDLFDTPPRPVK